MHVTFARVKVGDLDRWEAPTVSDKLLTFGETEKFCRQEANRTNKPVTAEWVYHDQDYIATETFYPYCELS